MEKWIQITAGRGPAECCWLVAQLLKLLLKEAGDKSILARVLQKEKGVQNRTLSSVLVQLKGEKQVLEQWVEHWEGTILWIGKSPFRKYHKRKNWFVGVNVIDPEHSDTSFKESDIQYQVFRSGGPGGQHANKVSSAVRALHHPTGCSATSSDSRSQQQNRKKARERLIQMVKMKEIHLQREQLHISWQNHNQLERGNPARTFKGSRLTEI